MRATLIALAAAVAGCALLGRRTAALPPLDTEGELVVEVRPAPRGENADLAITAVRAVRVDGAEVPLQVLAPRLVAGIATHERMLARGRLEPGQYTAVLLALGNRPAESQPEHVEARFAIVRRHVTVLELETVVTAGTPSFRASVPPRPLPQVVAYCSDFESHDVAVIDKLTRRVGDVLATGRGPWGVALDNVLGRAYVALSGEDRISVIDVASGEELNRIHLNLGDGPRELGLTPDRRLLVSANAGSNTVSFVDAAAMIEVGRAAVGQEPTSVLVDRRGARAYVTNLRSASISVLDLATRTVAATISTEDQPLRPQLDRSGTRLYVVHPWSAFLTVFSLPDLALSKRVYVGVGNAALKVDPTTDLLYLAKSGEARIAIYDPFSLIPVAGIDALEGVVYMAIDDAENALFLLSPSARAVGVAALAQKRLTSVVDVGASPRVLVLAGERN